MIVWTCTRAKHTMHKEVAGEDKKNEENQTKLSTKSRSLNKCYNYLFVCSHRCSCGKGEFCCLFFARFSCLCLRFRICMQRTKMTCFTFSAMLYCVHWIRLYALWIACFNWNIIYVANSKRFFTIGCHNYSMCIACVRQSLNRNHKKHTLTVTYTLQHRDL